MITKSSEAIGKARLGTLCGTALLAALVLRPPCWPWMQEGGDEAGHWATKLNLAVAVAVVVSLTLLLDRIWYRIWRRMIAGENRADNHGALGAFSNPRPPLPIWPALFAGMLYKTFVDSMFASRGGAYGNIDRAEQWLNVAGLVAVLLVGYAFTRFWPSRSRGDDQHPAGAAS